MEVVEKPSMREFKKTSHVERKIPAQKEKQTIKAVSKRFFGAEKMFLNKTKPRKATTNKNARANMSGPGRIRTRNHLVSYRSFWATCTFSSKEKGRTEARRSIH